MGSEMCIRDRYVVWSNEILSNKHLIREIQGATGDEEYQKVTKSESNSDDFRKKFPANLRTPDGHYVRSRAEILIDDFLYKNGLPSEGCLLYTSDAADDSLRVDLGGRRIIKKSKPDYLSQ